MSAVASNLRWRPLPSRVVCQRFIGAWLICPHWSVNVHDGCLVVLPACCHIVFSCWYCHSCGGGGGEGGVAADKAYTNEATLDGFAYKLYVMLEWIPAGYIYRINGAKHPAFTYYSIVTIMIRCISRTLFRLVYYIFVTFNKICNSLKDAQVISAEWDHSSSKRYCQPGEKSSTRGIFNDGRAWKG